MAFLSNLAALEAFVGGLGGTVRWSRRRLILAVLVVECVLMLPSSLDPSIIATLDLVFGSGMMIFGSALALIGVTWGLGPEVIRRQISRLLPSPWGASYELWVRWVVPAALLIILAGYLYAAFL